MKEINFYLNCDVVVMNQDVHNKLIAFIWSIADSCLRDVYVRGKYRDVILPMVVLRRLDTLLEPTKDDVIKELQTQKDIGLTEDDKAPLEEAAGYAFYNRSHWTLTKLYQNANNNPQILLQNFQEYFNGFSDNVQEILKRFDLMSKVAHMTSKNVLLFVLEKFISPEINLTPEVKKDPEGNDLPALTNLGMGYVFEELIRKFNEENNEEAGEHFTPREVIELMTHLVFDPIKANLPEIISIYDPACGSGGMLTESESFIKEKYPNANYDFYLYGKEINDETYAICKSDLIIKSQQGDQSSKVDNIKVGSTLSVDSFSSERFDFMLSNPPYGKSWSSEESYIRDKSDKTVIDPRFKVKLTDYWGNQTTTDALPRTSDGQLLFLMEMVSKMKQPQQDNKGSRIASVHNGSSLFTGDAGSGESNIRRYLIENDYLDAIVQLPNNLFYNTGITTYIWVLDNNKPQHRQGKVQLIDGNLMFAKLRKNLGDKNCELTAEHIQEITQVYLDGKDVERQTDANDDAIGIASKVFKNSDLGYYKVSIERPDRRRSEFTSSRIAILRFDKNMLELMQHVYAEFGDLVYQIDALKQHESTIKAWCEAQDIKYNNKIKAKIIDAKHWLKFKTVHDAAEQLQQQLGDTVFTDFNAFKQIVDSTLKQQQLKLSPAQKKAIVDAMSEYDEAAAKVYKIVQLSNDKIDHLLNRYQCTFDDLPDFGYTPTGTTGEFKVFESNSELRDSETIPLSSNIHQYFLKEVKPHVAEAWINLETVKIGYEISFNKYFYRHKPLRSLEVVASELIALERETEGVIADILGVDILNPAAAVGS